MVKAETVTRHRSWLFTLFFAHINICHLFHLLWPCLLHCHLPSPPFPFFSLSSSSSTFFQHSHLFWPFPVSANMLQFLPNLRSNMALPISSPAHLVQSNIHLLPFTETVPITLCQSLPSQASSPHWMHGWLGPASPIQVVTGHALLFQNLFLLISIALPPLGSAPTFLVTYLVSFTGVHSPALPTHCLRDCCSALHVVSFSSLHLSGNLIHKHTICTDDSQIHLCLPICLFLSGLKSWPVLLAFPHRCLASSSNLV